MNDDEDLELAALQRQLDDAFETTRPRAGFEDELWLRMQSKRPVWLRLQDAFTGFVDALKEAPALPAATVAVVLVLAIGVGLISLGRGPAGPASLATSEGGTGAQYAGPPGAFGRLPSPALQPTLTPTDSGPKVTNPEPSARGASLYYGPAKLEWAGNLTVQVTGAPVYRYAEPSAAAADQFAASLGAGDRQSAQGYLGSYASDAFTLDVRGSTPAPSGEPFFFLQPSPPAAARGSTSEALAGAYLATHSMVPTWPYVVSVSQSGDVVRVRYLRQFQVPGQADAYAVDGLGERYGLEVDVKDGRVQGVAGPLPIALDSAMYSIISGDEAVRFALASSPSLPATLTPLPTVRLTSAELVYALAWAGDHSFYEPAFLFSGTFTYNGTTYVKRVLVPAVAPSQRSS